VNGLRGLEKLRSVMGLAKAEELIRATMRKVGVSTLDSPDDMARFADELMRSGGLMEAVGRAMKIQALLSGAKVTGGS
jgi:hypothetical protein